MMITHTSASGRTRSVLVHASAGFKPDCLKGYRADVAFLGVGPLGKQTTEFRNDYWRETVETVKARRVFPSIGTTSRCPVRTAEGNAIRR